MASRSHVLQFADMRITAARLCRNVDLVMSVNLVYAGSLHLRQLTKTVSSFECSGVHSSCSVFESFGIPYQGTSRMFWVVLHIAYTCAVLLSCMGCRIFVNLAMNICGVYFVRPFLLLLCLVFSYICDVLCYTVSSSVRYKSSDIHGLVLC